MVFIPFDGSHTCVHSGEIASKQEAKYNAIKYKSQKRPEIQSLKFEKKKIKIPYKITIEMIIMLIEIAHAINQSV